MDARHKVDWNIIFGIKGKLLCNLEVISMDSSISKLLVVLHPEIWKRSEQLETITHGNTKVAECRRSLVSQGCCHKDALKFVAPSVKI